MYYEYMTLIVFAVTGKVYKIGDASGAGQMLEIVLNNLDAAKWEPILVSSFIDGNGYQKDKYLLRRVRE